MSFFLFLFFFIVSISILYLVFFLSNKFNFVDKLDTKKIHKEVTPNAAGIALIPLIIIFNKFITQNFIANTFIILLIFIILIGFIDDRFNLKPLIKIFYLFIITIIFILNIGYIKNLGNFFGFELYMGKYGAIFTIGCLLLIINSANYIDGQDGVLGISMIISLLYFLNFAYDEKESSLVILFIIYNLSFLLFNFNILPKQFLGDSGSLANGFILGFVSVNFVANLKIINSIIVIWPLAFYVFEFISINLIRYKNKKNILKKDLNFIFNILSRKFGQKNSLIFCSLIHLMFCFIGYFLNKFYISNNIQILSFISLFFTYIFFRLKMKFYN